jgi:two-component system sensor histidine kinase KdpD
MVVTAPRAGGVLALSPGRLLTGLALALVGLPLVTALLVSVRDELALASVLLLYLLADVVIAAVGGLVPGVLAAVLSFGAAYWFFTPPFHSLAIHGKDALLDLAVFGVVTAIVSLTVELEARNRAAHQRELAEQAVRTRELAAEDRVRSALLAAVGHDLRTPLANVKAAVGTLRQRDITWAPEQRAELLATIEQSTDRLSGLVTNLLDVTRLRANAVTARLEPVVLDEVVVRAVMRDDADVVRVDVRDDLPPVLADPVLLERVLENLVVNAVRFSPAGVPVLVRAEATGPAPGPGPGARGPGQVAVHVVDHGPGIPVERRSEMFGAFQRLDDRASGSHVGLGLAIAQGFTEAMGGHIIPSTTPGGGLTMTVTLPAALS